jgi:hypothetical protein
MATKSKTYCSFESVRPLRIWPGVFARDVRGESVSFVIPSGVRHSARSGPEGTVAVDIFSPPREDWERLEREEPRPPRGPAG